MAKLTAHLMKQLYPLKFKPILKETLWGGNKLKEELGKDTGILKNVAESWEISAVPDNISVVENGFLAGNNLQEIAEIYMGDLLGDSLYDKFGIEFPLLVKFIDANKILSIQVHPNDDLARKRHNAYGKTEMWYVIQADEGAELITGFNRELNKKTYLNYLKRKALPEILNYEKVKEGDVFFIPAGRVHAIGPGILLAEIQETSDITYRIYDWDRVDKNGKSRTLHTDLAIDAIDYHYFKKYKTTYEQNWDRSNRLVACKHFTTNLLQLNRAIEKDYSLLDSFVIYMCVHGAVNLKTGASTVHIGKGETYLLPAVLKEVRIIPEKTAFLLEIYIKKDFEN